MNKENYKFGYFGSPFFNDEDTRIFSRLEDSYMKSVIKENDDCYVIDVEVPGAKKEDIDLKLEDGYLFITYTVKEDSTENYKYLKNERFFGKLKRSFYVGKEKKKEQIEASYENGILRIVLPKLKPEEKEAESKKILIK